MKKYLLTLLLFFTIIGFVSQGAAQDFLNDEDSAIIGANNNEIFIEYPEDSSKNDVVSWGSYVSRNTGTTSKIKEFENGTKQYISYGEPDFGTYEATVFQIDTFDDQVGEIQVIEDGITNDNNVDVTSQDVTYSNNAFIGAGMFAPKVQSGVNYGDNGLEYVAYSFERESNSGSTSWIVDPDRENINYYDEQLEQLEVRNFNDGHVQTIDFSDIGTTNNNLDAGFYDPDEDLWVHFNTGDGEWTIGDENSTLDSGTIETPELQDSSWEIASVAMISNDRFIINGDAIYEYVDDPDSNSGKTLEPVVTNIFDAEGLNFQTDVNDNLQSEYTENLDSQTVWVQSASGDSSDAIAFDYSGDEVIYEGYPSSEHDFIHGANSAFDSVTQLVQSPIVNSLILDPSTISFDSDFSVDYNVEDPNNEGISEVETILYDTDGVETIASATKSYFDQSDNVQVSDSISRNELENDAGTSELFESEGEYEIEIRVTDEDNKVTFSREYLTATGDFHISNPTANRIEDSGDTIEGDVFEVGDEFQAQMNYVNGREDDEMDIYFRPTDGWEETAVDLDDNEWYSDTAIKTGEDISGEVNSILAVVGEDFPFEDTMGEFEIIGLANEGDSVPTSITTDEISNFDLQTDKVTFEVREEIDNEDRSITDTVSDLSRDGTSAIATRVSENSIATGVGLFILLAFSAVAVFITMS